MRHPLPCMLTSRALRVPIILLAILLVASGLARIRGAAAPVGDGPHLRVNQVGYRPGDPKIGIAFGSAPFDSTFAVLDDETGTKVFAGKGRATAATVWGRFRHHVELDFTSVARPGRYRLELAAVGARSIAFAIGETLYGDLADTLLEFMRQQRCGYNPFLDAVCHPYDGRTAFGPHPDGTYLDARGGWHDAGDTLKYLLTSSNAAAQLLLAYRLAPGAFGDRHDALGRPGANGQADVLDEARWGLEWMLNLHPGPRQLYHQVADDRDHIGWRLPQNDTADYGWGPGLYRVAYFATGRPQGLREYQSASDGVANLAGRYAAAMAMAYLTWRDDPRHAAFARRCLTAASEVYGLGKQDEGVQQGNSYGAPYRYAEDSWADDMEWGAAELFRATGEEKYREDAEAYARRIGAYSWMGRDHAGHYQFYPFMNLGHYALQDQVKPESRNALRRYYEEGLRACEEAGRKTPYGIGVPFIWCSNNLVVALATQGFLQARMSGEEHWARFATLQRDWLLGRNPWGTSMLTGVPEGGVYPNFPHLSTTHVSGRRVRGGLVDGPVAEEIFRGLKGVALSRPDPFEGFQSELAVYHDDLHDYATNEPTMDGTASAILLFALQASAGQAPR